MQDISSKNKARHYTRSSSFFMAMLFTILCGAVALTLGYFINYFAKGHFVHSTQAVIDAEVRYIEALGYLPEIPQDRSRLYIVLDTAGHLPEEFPEPSKVLTEGLLVFDFSDLDKRYAARIHTLRDHSKILVATDITDVTKDYDFMQLIGLASIAFVMMVVFVSYVISVFVVSGTNKIAQTAHEIIRTGDLSRRVDVKARWDDLSNVAYVLNLLLDRVQSLMQGVRHVSDNIAHDLRTPLTRMRNHHEDLQKKYPKDASIRKLLLESDQLLNTFNALLRISRIETEQQRAQFTEVSLDQVIHDVIEFYEPLAEGKNILIQKTIGDVHVHGDRDLLFQAYANILDNAIKYTPENEVIEVHLLKDQNVISISVENSGVQLDEQDLTKIFDRFYRSDKSRSTSGTGLGLSMVAAVIALHNGKVSAQNTENGFKIITYL